MKDKVIIQAVRASYMTPKIMLIGGIQHPNGQHSVFEPLVLKRLDNDEAAMQVDPFMQLDHDVAQQLMDELYNIGFRATNEQVIPDKARESHIYDLRKIAFKLLKIDE